MAPVERVTIRDAEGDDADAIRAVTLAAYAQYEGVMPEAHWEMYRRHILHTLRNVGVGEQLVALAGSRLVGSVLLYPPGTSFDERVGASMSEDCPEVRLLAVDPDGRGRGVGRALMEECVARCRRRSAPGMVLHTLPIMEGARRLYDRMGFVAEPTLDFDAAPGWHVEGYRLALDPD